MDEKMRLDQFITIEVNEFVYELAFSSSDIIRKLLCLAKGKITEMMIRIIWKRYAYG